MPLPIVTVSLPPPESIRMKLIPMPEGQVAVVSGPVGSPPVEGPPPGSVREGLPGTIGERGAPEAVQPEPSRVSIPVG